MYAVALRCGISDRVEFFFQNWLRPLGPVVLYWMSLLHIFCLHDTWLFLD